MMLTLFLFVPTETHSVHRATRDGIDIEKIDDTYR